MTDSTPNAEARATWQAAASGWAKWEDVFSSGLAGATDTLIDMAGARPGMRVLDLACGAGNQTIQLAKRIGPKGSVVACDISRSMLDHMRRNAARAGLETVETLECAADELDDTLAPFDAAISRLGLMLFPSPGSALKAVQRVLKPGARFAALVFTTPAANPYMAQPMAILLRHAGKSPPGPGKPGIFALGADGVLETLMKDSGLAGVEAKKVRASISLPSASDALEMMQQAFGAYRAVIADLSEAQKAEAWAAVSDCLREFESGGAFEAEIEFVIGSGSRAAEKR